LCMTGSHLLHAATPTTVSDRSQSVIGQNHSDQGNRVKKDRDKRLKC
jgi:hypothetical protein